MIEVVQITKGSRVAYAVRKTSKYWFFFTKTEYLDNTNHNWWPKKVHAWDQCRFAQISDAKVALASELQYRSDITIIPVYETKVEKVLYDARTDET